MDLVQVAGNI